MSYFVELKNVRRGLVPNDQRFTCERINFSKVSFDNLMDKAVNGEELPESVEVIDAIITLHDEMFNGGILKDIISSGVNRPLGLNVFRKMFLEDLLDVLLKNEDIDFSKYSISMDDKIVSYHIFNKEDPNLIAMSKEEEILKLLRVLGLRGTLKVFAAVRTIYGA